MAKFMLLIRGGDDATRDYTPEQAQQVLQRYIDWAAKLRREAAITAAKSCKRAARSCACAAGRR